MSQLHSVQKPYRARSKLLIENLKNRILVLDGAMGTALQDKNLTAKDFGGEALEGCNENLILTRPDIISSIHENYLKSGCDIIETNTFGGTPLVLDEYGLGSKTVEINKIGTELAVAACKKFDSNDKPRFVAGSIGPTTKAISVTGGITFEELIKNFYAQAKALYEGGADYFLIETCQDTRNIKACLLAIDQLNDEVDEIIPSAVSGTIEPMGTMLAGQSVDALMAALSGRDLLYLGLNCATGPEFMTDHIRSLAQNSKFRVSCVPNAGLPDENGQYLETPQMVGNIVDRFMDRGWVNVIGGCCGTHAGHIAELTKLAAKHKPRALPEIKKSFLSGVDYLEITLDLRPVIVGERTNVIGSRKFKRLIVEEKFEEAAEIARAQVKSGAHIIDVCLANPDRDEISDMKNFMDIVIKKVRAPFMIDSTDEKVLEVALTYCQGKAIINSINLEDGEERFEKVIPLAKKFGAALVVGTIDDDKLAGMGVTRERKLEIAKRSYDLLVNKYGVEPEDIYWDPLVFPCATGDAQYVGSAVETIEGIRLIKEALPRTKTVLGISNVSFGLPEHGREVLNSVFLYHCVKSGLDLAIVNSEKLVRFAQITPEELKLSEDLLYNRGADPIAAFAAHFREKKVTVKVDKNLIPLDTRLANYILEGSKDGLAEDITLKLKESKPLDIINGPLMAGMDRVGKLFNENKLIVAEVLQSAEAMKAAVSLLEPFMEKNESSTRGSVLLATVKGDVHDIGKNLVDIILSNNGFRVINLGIKIPPEQLISAVRKHSPDIIGLSGLLVKSAQQMVITADDLTKAGIHTPMLVGGAALSSNFVDRQIAKNYTGTVAYAQDAMNGLELAKTIMDPEKHEQLKSTAIIRREELAKKIGVVVKAPEIFITDKRSSTVKDIETPPQPQDYLRHIIKNTPIESIWKFINPLMLYGRHLGIKGGVVRKLGTPEIKTLEPKAHEIWLAVEEVKEQYKNTPYMQPQAVYQYFHATGDGNTLTLWDDRAQNKLTEFNFPRQKKEDGLCLADYVSRDLSRKDSVALFNVTVGKQIRELAEEMKQKGDYLKSHIIQALALESAESYAEYLHSQLRKTWGFADSPEMTMMERFQAKYRGKRYSFGYPACPRLDDQAQLFQLLNPEDIGVQLTDGFMMDPEASVSAIAFHHPDALYFSVGNTEGDTDDNRSS
ncbi:MAG: methionine synthase [Xanthomonadaceae bacterium]|nr:methionine synthase [Xanthomonadaceae bacterium]